MRNDGMTVGGVRLGSVGRVAALAFPWMTGTLLAAAYFIGCSSSSGSSSGGCATLQSCCSAITNATIAASCTSTLMADQSLPDSDQTCAGSLIDFQSYCGTSGDGGAHDSGGDGGPAAESTGTCVANQPENATVTFTCPKNEVITGFSFVSFGAPTGTCGGTFKATSSCDESSAKTTLLGLCSGKRSCTFDSDIETFGDPCPGTLKHLDAQVTCGTVPSLGFVPSNVDLEGIDTTMLPDVEISTSDCTIDDSQISCAFMPTVPMKSILQNVNGVSITTYYVKSFKVDANAVLEANTSNAIAIVSLGTIDVEGAILAHGANGAAGAAGNGQGGPNNVGGGQAPGSDAPSGNAAGGGGYCGVGGVGSEDITGGIAWGSASIVPLAGGASGGGFNNCFGCDGAQGGGALQLVAGTSITVGSTGTLNANGFPGSYISGGSGGGSGDGGGSGGSILLEAPKVSIAGVVAANGGAGGGGEMAATDTTTATGGAAATAAMGAVDEGATGGSGSAGSTINGGAGIGTAAMPPCGGASGCGGGGGGGAGRIRINTSSGAASITGTVSPATGTSCATQGKVSQ